MMQADVFPPRDPYILGLIARAGLPGPAPEADAERRYREVARAYRRDLIQFAIMGLVVVAIAVATATGAFDSLAAVVAPAADAATGGLVAQLRGGWG